MPTTFSFDVGSSGKVSAAIYRAADPVQATLVLAHGAGAPRTHPFITDMAARLSRKGIDVVTFNFPYAEAGRRMPDRLPLLEAAWRAAIASVRARSGLPSALFIGGKSMGGRIATHIAAEGAGLDIAGVVLLGFPLRPPGKASSRRDELLAVRAPMLVVQGTRDPFGTAAEVAKLLRDHPRARVVPVEGGDHSLALPKREGHEAAERALDEAATQIASFIQHPTRPRRPRPRGGGRSRLRML